MAKVVSPLMGIRASGQLGKTLVYFGWKGLNCVRSHVTPANPNTTAQQGARTKMTNAVAAFHAAGLTETDLEGWRRFAGISADPLTYFNRYVKSHIDAINNSETWVSMYNDATDSTVAGQIDFSVDAATGKSLSVRWGTSPSYMPNTHALTEDAGTYEYSAGSLTEGARMYYQFYQTGGTHVESGIGQVDVATA
jgi:hypothetical protein